MPNDHPLPPRSPRRAARFVYGSLDVDESSGVLRCHYRLDDRPYVETLRVGPDRPWTPAAREAARLVHLLAGVSYYKAGAAQVIDLGTMVVRPGERDFLQEFYLRGLGEFAYRNGLSLAGVEIVGGRDVGGRVSAAVDGDRPLVPFGGGIDSLVSVDITSRVRDDVALFVVNRAGDRFAAVERAAAATGLPVLRAEREVDPSLLKPADPSAVFNGHVPITGILSAVAVLMALLDRRGAVVMSNEWSASRGNLTVDGQVVNHQFSKGDVFERSLRSVLATAFDPPPEYFSLLRSRSELWVARYFAGLPQFHSVVHSCNRAFHLDPVRRLDRWCGECDKCCFIDLILSPFLERPALAAVFGGREPLDDVALLPRFRNLVGAGSGPKPFECVGDVDECRTAAVLAMSRADRAGSPVLSALVAELGERAVAAHADADRLLGSLGPHFVPNAFVSAAALV